MSDDLKGPVVAGMLCVDLHLELPHDSATSVLKFEPGRLKQVGPLSITTGGAVANTGLALHRLGMRPLLVGKTGDDVLGKLLLMLLRERNPAPTTCLVRDRDAATSYSIVIQPDGADRMFLHHTGAGDVFRAEDVDERILRDAPLLHFGYPPSMRGMYLNRGDELKNLNAMARRLGVTTSLDLSYPDPSSEAGNLDWRSWFDNVLETVDIVLPSFDELLFMLEPARHDDFRRRAGGGNIARLADGPLLADLANAILDRGAAIVLIKLGDQGVYLRTTPNRARLSAMGKAGPRRLDDWRDREILAPCFNVTPVATTGSGDVTIAGFLAALLKHATPESAVTIATAVGACSVEAADATSGVPEWHALESRIMNNWERKPADIVLAGWHWNMDRQLRVGPGDPLHPASARRVALAHDSSNTGKVSI